jgi:hypothetical protein
MFIDEEIPLILRSDFVGWAFITAAETLLDTDTLLSMVIPDESNRDRILTDPTRIAAAESMRWQW